MKRILILFTAFLLLFAAGPSASAALPGQSRPPSILVVYFSYTGHTRDMANIIAEQTGGHLFAIVPAVPYPPTYQEAVRRWETERDTHARPALARAMIDMERYDTIFVGFPIWGGDIPHVVRTFLESYRFAGKTIIPFCTHGGSGFASSTSTLRFLVPGARILTGLAIPTQRSAACQSEVTQWLRHLDIIPGPIVEE